MKKFLFIALVLQLFSCGDTTSEPNQIQTNSQTYSVKTFQNADSNWGYQILKDNQLFINQPHIPAVSGKKGFSTKEKALTTGVYIIDKLKKGIIPPTISKTELEGLGVLE